MESINTSASQLPLSDFQASEAPISPRLQMLPQDLLIVVGEGGILTSIAVDIPGSRIVPIDSIRLPSARIVQPWADNAPSGPDQYSRLLRVDPEGRAAALVARSGRIALVLLSARPDGRSAGAVGGASVFRRAADGGPSLARATCPGGDIDDMAFLPSTAGGEGGLPGCPPPLRLAALARQAGGGSTVWVIEADASAAGAGAGRLTHRCADPHPSLSLRC